ncbi:MAG: hypothetical protein H5T68_09190 [Chloroflexi bacterium]|nr:hypothetical protein [Chloroflexota bacterium]
MCTNSLKEDIERSFRELCAEAGRLGIIGFSPLNTIRLLPQQQQYLQEKLKALGPMEEVTAISLGLLYHEQEILSIPATWQSKASTDDPWNEYALAYLTLNRTLNDFTSTLVARFGGVAEQATIEGWAGQVKHVDDYFPHCVSHRAFAEAAGLGWRGRHGLIVTPEAGPALRFATIFIAGRIPGTPKEFIGCSECHACLKICPILRKAGDYREACRQRIHALGLKADVCGICVRVCWEQIRKGASTPPAG